MDRMVECMVEEEEEVELEDLPSSNLIIIMAQGWQTGMTLVVKSSSKLISN